jgi:hypothetical protein
MREILCEPNRVLTVTLDTNLFYDKAEGRDGAGDFDEIVDLATSGKLQLFFTGTTDFEDSSGIATRVAIKLMMKGILKEDRNAGTPLEFMPGGPGLHRVDESTCDELLRHIWPNERWKSAGENKRNDVLHLVAHMRNDRDIFLTRDKELLDKSEGLSKTFHIHVLSPKDLLSCVRRKLII